MKAEELRIGMYVNLKDKGVYMIDSGYDIEKISDWYGTDYCTGITLTEEWLFKLGFGYNLPKNALWNEHEFLIGINKGEFYFGIWHDVNDDPYVEYVCDIKYVHELQTLHLIITSEELTISPKV